VSNVLSEEKQKQVIALGQLGWTLRPMRRKQVFGGRLPPATFERPGSRCRRQDDGFDCHRRIQIRPKR
jgi:hypothetical protein